MEFGIFLQGHVPRRRLEQDPDYEHASLIEDVRLAEEADRAGFKYVWVSEHHFLHEYSHISASEVFLGYLAAATERIHLGSAIFNITPPVNQPVRVAERVALLDHLSKGRFEFGTGRGAGSLEVTGFGIENTDDTKDMFEEVLKEFPRMWRETEYSFEGKYFSVPPRNVLPKPWKKPHPPIWQAAGNPPTYEKAARNGLGVLGFNFSSYKEMEPMVTAYKNAIGEAEPLGEFVNDNVMITNGVVCLSDGERARKVATDMGSGLLQSLVFRYHDTFPAPPGIPKWPALLPDADLEQVEWRINEGFLLCGDPDEVLEQVKKYESIGADQIVFGLPVDMTHEDAVETIQLFGKHVIPKLDPDPVHRTTKFRDAAAVTART
ncbi:MAG TPA: LLM class flavin-dependent oxidoreductase [Actinomycetota bacterium]|nr:LLM class flavin-dependent oxidoreductase [Actinomycetota bacterium]